MIKKVVSFALYQPLFIVLGTILFIGAGIAAFKNLAVEAFPDVTDVQVTVISLFPGHAPEEVEKQVTIPLEVVLSGLPGAVRMFSHTQFGLSFIILTFDDKANGYFARQQVVDRRHQPSPVATGRPRRLHSLHEPGYRRASARPAAWSASRSTQAVTPEPQ